MKQTLKRSTIILFLFCWAVPYSSSAQDSGNEEIRSLRKEIDALRGEVKLLRAELENMKTETSSITSTKVMIAQTESALEPEFEEFLRVSRRMVSAMGTGVSYLDFGQRLVEVNASAEEALSKSINDTQKVKIADFVLALRDAHNLWRYKVSKDGVSIRIESTEGHAHPVSYPIELGDRWNLNFSDLTEKYGLRDTRNFVPAIVDYENSKGEMYFDRAIERIFEYASKTFRELEKLKK